MGLLICVSSLQKLYLFNYVAARCSYNKGEPFEHNFPSNSLIILVILYFACIFLCIFLCILYINHVYIVFTAVLMGLGEILIRNSFWLCV